MRAPPSEGEANAALLKCLAAAMDLPKTALSLEAGAKGRLKTVAAEASPERLSAALDRLRRAATAA
ncbi:hypothetical protein GCM10011390_29480 [Aureimonas endophytica]|uniref:Uncharacterized protein n=1 Tax=Aureimonas endophytica TaxID=2027858 RepID=A0A916ZQV9_9HYPH|nr:hypothetical protein GCM10011390_29480 [Aureimonas endophytica]